MSIKGWTTQEKDDRLSPQYATVEPVRQLQNALSVLSHEFVREVGTDSVEASSTTTVINATGHAAQVGDVIRLTSGALSGQEVKVYSVAANSITLAEELASAPALGVTFQILRHKYPVVESTGEVKVTGTFTEVATAADGGALPALTKVVSGYDGSAVQVIKTDANGELQVDVLSSALPTGAATSSNQTDGSQKSQIVDGAGDIVDVVALNVALSATDKGLVTNTVIHGETTGGGGGYVDVKVTPSGALTVEATLVDIDAALDGQATMAASLPVVIASDQSAVPASQSGTWNINNVSGTVSLPTGAATASNQTTLGSQTTKINDGTNTAAVKAASTAAGATDPALVVAISPNSKAVDATQAGTWNINNVSGTVSLPTGAATETTLGAIKTAVELIDNPIVNHDAAAVSGTMQVSAYAVSVLPTQVTEGDATRILATRYGTLKSTSQGKQTAAIARIDYTSTNVTTSAYTTLLANTGSIMIDAIEIFDSSGQTLVLANGAAGSEVDRMYIFPGGNGIVPIYFAQSARIAIKAVSGTANSGEISVNFYYSL